MSIVFVIIDHIGQFTKSVSFLHLARLVSKSFVAIAVLVAAEFCRSFWYIEVSGAISMVVAFCGGFRFGKKFYD